LDTKSDGQKANPSENGRTLDEVRKTAVKAAEKNFIEEQLYRVNGNVTLLAKRLHMNRSYLQTLLKKRGIRAKDFKLPKSTTESIAS
jgi:DNA-binding NtrC family response regulator